MFSFHLRQRLWILQRQFQFNRPGLSESLSTMTFRINIKFYWKDYTDTWALSIPRYIFQMLSTLGSGLAFVAKGRKKEKSTR